MTETRNPSRKYFRRNQPYFYKSADNWEEWDTDESYDRTFFIGIDDSNPEDIDVALYMIWGGKPVAAVGSRMLDTVSGVVDTAVLLEEEIQSILEEVQEIAAALAQARIDLEEALAAMEALVDRCEGILEGAEAARDLAKDWATKMTGMVVEDGEPVDYSAKYYANEAKNSETAANTSAVSALASAGMATEQAAAANTSAGQAATSANTAASYAESANNDASSAANSAQASQDSATSAANSEANSANSATASANSASASANYAELSRIYANDKINQTHITNCITEIPQGIKLELNEGTLILKAGSKIYEPNGFEEDGTTPKFDVVVVESDKTMPMSSFSGFVFYRNDNNSFHFEALQPTSGTVPPSIEGTWYDTSANKIKRYANSSFVYDGISFPLCKFSSGSIDQIFNGFGYIGSTVFALPGVKGLIPDGRNADGTLKNIEVVVNSVSMTTIDSNWPSQDYMILPDGQISWYPLQAGEMKYNEEKNLWEDGRVSSGYSRITFFGHTTASSGTITSFISKTTFHALDYNDSSWVFKNIPVIDIPATSGTVTLADNAIYSGTMTGAMTFILPIVTDTTQYHQIKAMLYLPVVTIDWGTAHYIGGDVPDVSEAGQYMIYWDFIPALSAWAVGAMRVV